MNPALHQLADRVRPLRRTEYDALVAAGVFEGQRVELLHGMIVHMSPQNAPHSSTAHKLAKLLSKALDGRAEVRVQFPFIAGDHAEPEPDIAVVPLGDYDEAHPDYAYLLVEVADSSLRDDRAVKVPIYAAADVPEVWLVDVSGRRIEVYSQPFDGSYGSQRTVSEGDSLSPAAFPNVEVRVTDVLPRR